MSKKMKQVMMAGLVSILCATGLLVWTGCDTASADEELSVSPSSAVIKSGESVLFTVSGGYHYTWTLDPDDGSGQLSSSTGSEVRYFCLATNGTTPKKIIVTSTIPGSGSNSSTNSSTSNEYQVSASIQIYYTGAQASETVSALTISPSSSSVKTNATKTFSASGGKPPYSWALGGGSSGSLTANSGDSTVYTAPSSSNSISTTSTLILKDSASGEKTATISITGS